MRILCTFVILLFAIANARAEIRIDVSRYSNGETVVIGTTGPNKTVTLDGKYTTQSDAAGRFNFHVKYKPDLCMTDINAGADVYSAVIAGCFLPAQIAVPEVAPKTGKPPS